MKIICLISTISLSIFLFNSQVVYANPQDTPTTFEEQFTEGKDGYISVEESVMEFTTYCKCEVKLPTITPPISFTHKFGRFFDDKEYKMNTSLEIMFVNENIKDHIFKIEIRPLNNKVKFEGEEFLLHDGVLGIYFESQIFNFFVFEKNNLQYLLGIHKSIANEETPDFFIDIANSI